jgi:heme exporter protein B
VGPLLAKEFLLEWRRRAAFSGLALYLFSTSFICYITFNLQRGVLSPVVWSALFWIVVLFTAMHAGAKSFLTERRAREIYYYSIVSPESVILSKIAYNFFLISALSFGAVALFAVLIGNPVQQPWLFAGLLALASFGLAASLTLPAGIAARAANSGVLMAVLSFPVVVAILALCVRVTRNCIDGIDPSLSMDELLTLAAIDAIAAALSYVLFPFVWRS